MILVMDSLAEYILRNTDESRIVVGILTQFLDASSFRIIGLATSIEEQHLRRDFSNLMKSFETIAVAELSPDATLEVLYRYFERTEDARVAFTDAAYRRIVELSGRYDWQTPFPARAINLAEETLEWWLKGQMTNYVTPELVDDFLGEKTGMPIGAIGQDEKTKLLNLEQDLHRRVIGQHEAITELSEALRKARTGIGNSKRPIASFLFLGPTGVGKTETVKAIAETFFGNEARMIRLDMSEYQTPAAIEHLIGSAHDHRLGFLTRQAKEAPFSVMLLDEVEKAHRDVLDLFLQVLEDGFLTDAFGEKINFRNMVIVATSNAGTATIREGIDQRIPPDQLKRDLIEVITTQSIFRMEFLNRFDGIVLFRPLDQEELIRVARLQLAALTLRLRQEKNIRVQFEDGLAPVLVERGYEPTFGARSLRRFIENTLEDRIARRILADEIRPGTSVTIGTDDIFS